MPPPTKYLERTRGRILSKSERLRVASRLQLHGRDDPQWAGLDQVRGRLVGALTDRRLILVSEKLLVNRARLLAEWPVGALAISVRRQKLGNNLLRISLEDGNVLVFEWLGGNRPREWASFRYRQLDHLGSLGPTTETPGDGPAT